MCENYKASFFFLILMLYKIQNTFPILKCCLLLLLLLLLLHLILLITLNKDVLVQIPPPSMNTCPPFLDWFSYKVFPSAMLWA